MLGLHLYTRDSQEKMYGDKKKTVGEDTAKERLLGQGEPVAIREKTRRVECQKEKRK